MKLDVPDTQSPQELTRRGLLGVGVAIGIVSILGCSDQVSSDTPYSLNKTNLIDLLSSSKSTMKTNLSILLLDIYTSKSSAWFRDPSTKIYLSYTFPADEGGYQVEIRIADNRGFQLRMTDNKTFDFTFDESSSTITSSYETNLNKIDENFGKVQKLLAEKGML